MVDPSDAESLLLLEHSVGRTDLSREDLDAFCAGSQDVYATGQLRLIIDRVAEATDTACAVGAVDLFDFDAEHLRAGVGIAIAPAFQQRGLATEALAALTRYAQYGLKLRSLYAHVPVDNPASVTLFEKASYRRVGLMMDWVRRDNKWVNAAVFQMAFVES
jgi:diamine N-acetyltransferase